MVYPAQPTVVNEANEPISVMEASEIYGGAIGRACYNAFAYEYMGKKGVSLYLKGLQRVSGGEPFSVGSSPVDEFASPF